ncbi:MAG: DUF4185 domain-containing protein [Chloroflexota bacterium]|nr:DUF4185 domain-containing protein [Chloroflexota bacterium]
MKLAAVALFVLVAAWTASSTSPGIAGEAPPPEPPLTYGVEPNLPVAVAARRVCRLVADNPAAADATVLGVDGAASVVAGGQQYWLFGDTFRHGPGGRRDVIPAGLATSTDFDGHDCVDLTFKTDADGIVTPMFPRSDETTAWPDGALALPDGNIMFYMVKTYRQSPTEWHVGTIGLGVIPPGSFSGTRLVERIWDAGSGFHGTLAGARSPVLIGDNVLVYINTDAGNYLARAPLERIGEASAYTYWDGGNWSAHPDEAQALWTPEPSPLPSDNGLSVTFNEHLGKWLAVYNADFWSVKVRLADQPWGPWSQPITWFDCQPLAGEHYPYCYSSAIHGELSPHDGSTIYVTFANPEPYDVSLVELRLGVAIHAWTGERKVVRYGPVRPDGSYTDAGVAFYASDAALPGLVPIYEFTSAGAYRYALDAPSPVATPAFFAYGTPSTGAVHTRPLYRWQRDGEEILDTADRDGWVRGEIAFQVPCIDVIRNGTGTECAS